MPTEHDWKDLLVSLETKHPIDGMKPEDIQILYAGWGMGQAMIRRKTIVVPRGWLKLPIIMQFAIVHEYAHFYREKMGAKKLRLGFHDKEMKRIETEFMAANGITLKRWVKYPRWIKSEKYGRINLTSEIQLLVDSIIMTAISINLTVSIVVATVFEKLSGASQSASFEYFLIALLGAIVLEPHLVSIIQNIRWLRSWLAKRKTAKGVATDG